MIAWLLSIANRIKSEIKYRKKMREIKKRDPHIYK